MKYALALLPVLAGVWILWSGHLEPFMLALGFASCLLVVVVCWRMGILDAETVPSGLGLGPLVRYATWLLREIVVANLDVARRIVSRQMPIAPTMTRVSASQRTDLGRVILANSITLTPGTVSVDVSGNEIQVHALTSNSASPAALAEMDRRVRQLEGGG